jgi:hypothetical protein
MTAPADIEDIDYMKDIAREGSPQELDNLLNTLWKYESDPVLYYRCLGLIRDGIKDEEATDPQAKKSAFEKFQSENTLPDSDDLGAFAAVLEKRIKKIETVGEPGEQLLRYKILKDAYEPAYDPSKGHMGKDEKVHSTKEYLIDKREETWLNATGLALFAAAFIVGAIIFQAAVIASPLACLALLGVSAAFCTGGGAVGAFIGRKLGINKFNKLPAEKQHESRLFELNRGVEAAIMRLSSTKKENLDVLSRSKYWPDIEKELPPLGAAFAEVSQRRESRRAFVQQPTPQALTAAAPNVPQQP